ncbi:MAG: RNA polymerase sigma factor [Limisphaerales bacterium]
MPDPGDHPTRSDWTARLYDERAAQLVLYGRALGLGHAESQDVVHDVFRALMELPEAPRQPDHYLIRAFRNRAMNHRRGLFRRILRELESARWFEREPTETPAERAAMTALAKLPTDQREAIVLKLWHGLTFEAMGELLAISPHTAAGRYRYGLQKLRSRLTEDSHELTDQPGSDPSWLQTPKTLPEA